MAGRWRTTYKYSSIHLAVPASPEIYGGDPTIARQGFLILEIDEPGIYLAQSVENWQLYKVKVFKKRLNPDDREEIREDEFFHPAPPEVRVSTIPPELFTNVQGESRVISVEDYFQDLVYFYSPDGEYWTLYYEYLNGGTLENLIQKYSEKGRSIPEMFIWHVAAELSKALAHMYYGWSPVARQGVDDWTMAYHRAIDPTNILLNYAPRSPGAAPRVGIESNAFPRIALAEFQHSAIQDDDNAWLQPGLQPDEAEPNFWEDTYHLGRVLRLMCMTHIPYGQGIGRREQTKNERGEDAQYHRPDSRFVADANRTPGLTQPPNYTPLLMETLGEFEWDGQKNMDIADPECRGNVQPGIEWVMDTLLPRAERLVDAFRWGPFVKERGHFTAVDVSWTRPLGPLVPIFFNDGEDNTEQETSLDRMEHLLRADRNYMENCEIQFPLPKYRPAGTLQLP